MSVPERIDDETLMAFADGELPPDRAAAVTEAVEADPVLAARAARFRAVRERFADLPIEAPDAAALMARAKAAVARREAWRPGWPAAMAAGVAGVVVGLGLMTFRAGGDPVGPDMQARGPLAVALSTAGSGASVSRGVTRATPLYTLAAADGRVCRGFRMTRDGQTYEGAACREGEVWRMVVVALAPPHAPRPAGGFGQAGSPEPAAVAAAVDALHPGDPLSAADEAALIRRGWRTE